MMDDTMTAEGFFGRMGVLADDGARAQCHLCGRWFAHLGNHVARTHGMTCDDYRVQFGLKMGTGLISPMLADKRRANAEHLVEYPHHQDADWMRQISRNRYRSLEEATDPTMAATRSQAGQKGREVVAQKRAEGTFQEPFATLTTEQRRLAQMQSQEVKRQKMLTEPGYRERVGRAISEARRARSKVPWEGECVICGSLVRRTGSKLPKTCGRECDAERRRRNLLAKPLSPWTWRKGPPDG